MKNKKATDIVCYTLLFTAWFLSGFTMSINIETAVLLSVFLLSCAVYFFVKNVRWKSIIVIMLTAAASIYTYEYILLYIPVLMLLIMFDFIDRKDSNNIYETCNTSYIVICAFKILYLIYLVVTKAENYVSGRLAFYSEVAGIIVMLFILLIFTASKKDLKIKSNKTGRLKAVYISSIAGIVIDVCILALKNAFGKLQAAQFDFSVWFVLVLFLMYFRDPFSEVLFSKINDRILLFLGVTKRSK